MPYWTSITCFVDHKPQRRSSLSGIRSLLSCVVVVATSFHHTFVSLIITLLVVYLAKWGLRGARVGVKEQSLVHGTNPVHRRRPPILILIVVSHLVVSVFSTHISSIPIPLLCLIESFSATRKPRNPLLSLIKLFFSTCTNHATQYHLFIFVVPSKEKAKRGTN